VFPTMDLSLVLMLIPHQQHDSLKKVDDDQKAIIERLSNNEA
jgi:hypothetical protein